MDSEKYGTMLRTCISILVVIAVAYFVIFSCAVSPGPFVHVIKEETKVETPQVSPLEALRIDACGGKRIYDPSYFHLPESTTQHLRRLILMTGTTVYEDALEVALMRHTIDARLRGADIDRMGDQISMAVGSTLSIQHHNGTVKNRVIAGISRSRVRFEDGGLVDMSRVKQHPIVHDGRHFSYRDWDQLTVCKNGRKHIVLIFWEDATSEY